MNIKCGSAKKTIVPLDDLGDTYLAGYLTMMAPKISGVRDPIHTRAIVLDDGSKKIALISVEVIGLLSDFTSKVREKLSAYGFPTKNVYIFSTHTHAGPDTMGLWGPLIGISGINKKYMFFLMDKIIEAVLEAENNLRECNIYYSINDLPNLVENYREEKEINSHLKLLKFKSDAELIATLWTYSAQPEITTRENTLISGDYPGLVSQMIENEYGGISLFALGLCGAQSPIYCEMGYEQIKKFAEEIFANIQTIYEKEELVELSPIEIRSREIEIPLENGDFELLFKLGIFNRDYKNGMVKTTISKVRIGNLDFINIPGEPFPSLFSKIIESRKENKIIFISHSNDSIGYFIPIGKYNLKPQVWVDNIENGKFIGHETESVGSKAGEIVRKTVRDLFRYKNILAVGSHADDLTIWAGGTLKKLSSEGNSLVCVRITDDYADSVGISKDRAIKNNRKEVERAYKVLGAKEVIHLDYPTDSLCKADYFELRGKLVHLMRKYKPDIVISFDLNGTDEENMDHIITARAVNEACWQSSFDLFYTDDFEKGLDIHAVGERYLFARNPTVVNFHVDITDYIEEKIKAISQQKTVLKNWFYQNKLLARANNLYIELLEEDVPNSIRVNLLVKLVYGEIGEKYGTKFAEEFNKIDAGFLQDLAED